MKLGFILFDTGALHRSYISEELVSENRLKWKNNIKNNQSLVRLADQRTVVGSKEELLGTLTIVGNDNEEYTAELNFIVWSMPGMDIIIGLPNITDFYKDKLVQMISTMEMESGETMQWSHGVGEESEEELNTEIPCSFTEALNFMNSLDSHIGDYLKTYLLPQRDPLDAGIGGPTLRPYTIRVPVQNGGRRQLHP